MTSMDHRKTPLWVSIREMAAATDQNYSKEPLQASQNLGDSSVSTGPTATTTATSTTTTRMDHKPQDTTPAPATVSASASANKEATPDKEANALPQQTLERTNNNGSFFQRLWGHSQASLLGSTRSLATPEQPPTATFELDATSIQKLLRSQDLPVLQAACEHVARVAHQAYDMEEQQQKQDKKKSSKSTSEEKVDESSSEQQQPQEENRMTDNAPQTTDTMPRSTTRDLCELALRLQARILDIVVQEQHEFKFNAYKVAGLHRRLALLWLSLPPQVTTTRSKDENDETNDKDTPTTTKIHSGLAPVDHLEQARQHLEFAMLLSQDKDRHQGLRDLEDLVCRASLWSKPAVAEKEEATKEKELNDASLVVSKSLEPIAKKSLFDSDDHDAVAMPPLVVVDREQLEKSGKSFYKPLGIGLMMGMLLAVLLFVGFLATTPLLMQPENDDASLFRLWNGREIIIVTITEEDLHIKAHPQHHTLQTIHRRRFGGYTRNKRYGAAATAASLSFSLW